MGFSFVEPIFKNKSEIFSSLKCDIYYYASKLSAKFSITLKYFDEWKLMALDKIKGAFTYDVRCRGGFKMLTVGENCFKSSGSITIRETTALIYSPKRSVLSWIR